MLNAKNWMQGEKLQKPGEWISFAFKLVATHGSGVVAEVVVTIQDQSSCEFRTKSLPNVLV